MTVHQLCCQAHRDVENTGSTAPTSIRLDTAVETQEVRTAALEGTKVTALQHEHTTQGLIFYAKPGECGRNMVVLTQIYLRCTDATRQLRDAGAIKGWRDELYPVTDAFHIPPLALIERAATAYFGIKVGGSCAPSGSRGAPRCSWCLTPHRQVRLVGWLTGAAWSIAGVWCAHQRLRRP